MSAAVVEFIFKRILPGALVVLALVAMMVAAHQRGFASAEAAGQLALEAANSKHDSLVKGLRADLTRQALEHEGKQRALEAHWRTEFDKVSEDAQKQIERVAADKRAADAVSDQLRQQARVLAAVCGAGPASAASASAGAASASAAGFSPGVVLADVFGWADETAGELAQAYDRARSAGLACERANDTLRGKK